MEEIDLQLFLQMRVFFCQKTKVSIMYNYLPIYTLTIIILSFIEASEVMNLQVESANNTTLVISWEPPATPNGNILSYSVSIINLKDGSAVRQENVSVETDNLTETNLGK